MTLSRSPDHGDTAAALMRRGGVGIADLPGFEASLRLLLERERYSVTDIALMFGVSRERMRQLCARLDLTHPDGGQVGLNCVRVWDDRAHQFRPVGRSEIAAQERRARSATRRAQSGTRQALRRQRIVAELNVLRAELRREPSWPELAQRLFDHMGTTNGCAARVLSLWDSRSHDTGEKLREFCETTGYVPRPPGTPGHLGSRQRQTHCSRCGTEIRTLPGGGRYCPNRTKHRALSVERAS